MAAALCFYWIGCGFVTEGRHWLDRALALDPEPTSARARALYANAHVLVVQGDPRAGADVADECRALARQCGDESTLAHGTYVRGLAGMVSGDHALADALCEDALDRFTALGELTSDAILTCVCQAMSAAFHEDFGRAVALARQACAMSEPHGEQWVYSYALYTLALTELPRGEFDQATTHAREALRLKKALRDLLGIAAVVDVLAGIAAAAGDGERAATLLGAAEQIWNSWGGQTRLSSQNWIGPHEVCERQARHALGDRAFGTAFARGAELDLDNAVAYALGEEPQPATETPVATYAAKVLLTRREQQVAELVAEGLTNKQIADRLVIAQRTTEGHVQRILTKLGFAKRAQVATWITEQRGTRGT